jgi:hypothetical protein
MCIMGRPGVALYSNIIQLGFSREQLQIFADKKGRDQSPPPRLLPSQKDDPGRDTVLWME